MQKVQVSVGPLDTADDDGITTARTLTGASGFVISGALSSGYSATSLAAAQSISGAGSFTLTSAAGNVDGRQIVIVSAGNDSGVTFTVKGIDRNGRTALTETVVGSNAGVVATATVFYQLTSVTTSGSTGGNTSIGVNGAVTLDKPRRVLFTTVSDESAKTFTITGTDWNNQPITETVTGPSSTTGYSVYDFKTVTSIVSSAATTGTVKVGTNGIASSRPIFLDEWMNAPTALQVVVSGTVNFTVQQTLDDPNVIGATMTYPQVTWVPHPDVALAGASATAQGNYAYVPRMVRILLNSGTGSCVLTTLQAGNMG